MESAEKKTKQKIRIASIGDIHMNESKIGTYKELFAAVSKEADILCLCGDLTHMGMPQEAELLLEELQTLTIPAVGVLGNHDYDKDMHKDLAKILSPKVTILNGNSIEINGIHFTGIKGFGGGFTPTMWGRIGEYAQKTFYDEAEREAEKLENALNELFRMQTTKIVTLMHFSPIRETVVGEIVELYPFLGSSRFEEVLDRYPITAIMHGHSHFGSPNGKTGKGSPVYNVSMLVNEKLHKDKLYRIIEV